MSDEIVIGGGQVSSVSGSYNADGILDVTKPQSYIHLRSMNNDLITFQRTYDGTDKLAGFTVPGKLEFGEEYEIVARPVKKKVPEAAQASGPRMFKDDEQ